MTLDVALRIAQLTDERDQALAEIDMLAAEVSGRVAVFKRIWEALRIPSTAATSLAMSTIATLWREHDALGVAVDGVEKLFKEANDLTAQLADAREQVRILQEGVSYVANLAGNLAAALVDGDRSASEVADDMMTLLINVLDRVNATPTGSWGSVVREDEETS